MRVQVMWRWWRAFRFWHVVVSVLVSAGLAISINVVTTTPTLWAWVVAVGMLIVLTIGLGIWDLARDTRADWKRATAARQQVLLDRVWPGPPDPPPGPGSGRPPDGHNPKDGVLDWLGAVSCPSPLRGRTAAVRQLLDWCVNGADQDVVRIVSGPGGVGKSRLVVEVARRLPESWFAGKLDPARFAQAVERMVACGQPTLIVVEDADRVSGVARLVQDVAAAGGAVRLVLTARNGAELIKRLRCDPDIAVASLLTPQTVLPLPPIGAAEDRQRWYTEAVAAYSKKLRVPRPDDPGTTVAVGRDGDVMVVLQARALLAVLNRSNTRQLTLSEVAAQLVGVEQERWQRDTALPDALTNSPQVVTLAVAVLSLLPAVDLVTAAEWLRRLPRFADDTAHEARIATAAWAQARYTLDSDGRLDLQPNLISEWLLMTALNAVPGLVADLPADLVPQVVDGVARACVTYPEHLSVLWDLLHEYADQLPDLIPHVLGAMAVSTDHDAVIRGEIDRALARLVNATIYTLDGAFLNRDIPARYPHLDCAYNRIRVRSLRELATTDPDRHRPDLADALGTLAINLLDLGEPRDALTADQEAVAIWRDLAATDPERYRPDLARTLNNSAVDLSEVGQHRGALTALEEAVVIWQDLAATDPERYRPDLARAITNIAVNLSEVGQHRYALDALEEAVAIRRDLTATDPDSYQPDLASVLTNMAIVLRLVGRPRDALGIDWEALALWRSLAAADPDRYRPDLAKGLFGLAVNLSEVGQHQDALTAFEETVAIRRDLAATDPERHQPDLAIAVSSLAESLRRVGQSDDALATSRDGIAAWRAVAATDPDRYRPHLAIALMVHANSLREVGRPHDALTADQEVVAIRRSLAATEPDRYRPDLADALGNFANSLREVGRPHGALTADQEAVAIRRSLAAVEPDCYRPDLAKSLNNLGADLNSIGQPQQAQAAWLEALDLWRDCAAHDPRLYGWSYRWLAQRLGLTPTDS